MDLDPAMIDHALTTTRAVRKRLDFDRDVPDQVLLDCIDVAEQAPTGGNQGSRRWLIIRDQATKDRMSELYLSAGGQWVIETADQLAGSGHPNERMMQGAKHLAENIARVPALVIPTIIGHHDSSGRPGLFDSVIQAAWSFAVALRARGLGTTWTTMFLGEADAVAELLDIPPVVTQICLFPVAYTIGTDFSPSSRRYPAREITFFDRYGRTIEGRRSEPRALGDGPGLVLDIDIAATADRVWSLVTDLDNHARWSDELQRAEWDDHSPGQGSTFTGHNRLDGMGEWTVTCQVVDWEPGRRFGWTVGSADDPAAVWRFTIEPTPGGATRLRYAVRLGPGPSGLRGFIEENSDTEAALIAGRQDMLRDNMQRTITGVKELAEASG